MPSDVPAASQGGPAGRGPAGADIALDGVVERVTFYNPTNGFSVVRLRVRGRRDPIPVVGTLPAAQPGEVLALRGRWQTDPRHGAQFRPTSAEVRPPSDADGIMRYLGSGLVRQIGPVLAKRIVGVFGERTLDVLDATPERVREVPGIGPQRAQGIAAAWAEHRALREIMAFLAEHGLDTRFAPRLVAAYGADAPQILGANPYRLVADVPGLGFPSADRIGKDRGVRHTAPSRLQAAVQAALINAGQNGHTRQHRPMLLAAAAAVAEVEPELIEDGVTQLLASGSIAVRRMDAPQSGSALGGGQPVAPAPAEQRVGRVRIFTPGLPEPPAAPTDDAPDAGLGIGLSGLVRAEEDLARRLLGLSRRPGLPAAHVERWLAADREAQTLSDEQRQAVATAATSGCFVLTGGPGVGKTTTTRALVRCLKALGRSVTLAAPTGKAARRLGEVVGLEARTLHRLLGAGPGGFRHGPDDPLPFDVVIVDEASMLDTQLARAVVRAIGPGAQLILVGDADQLPSVGPGQVLRDVLASGRIPSTRLETVFRQAAQSQIVTNAHRIRQGLRPDLGAPADLYRLFGKGAPGASGPAPSDCIFVPAPPARVAAVATEWAAERLPRLLGAPPGEIQAIAPLVRVCQTLNEALQQRLNPGRGQPERPHGALALRVGDRVIQTHNNYQLGVFNGDTGTILEMEANGGLTVDFGDGRTVTFGPADLLDLDHAYGLTVHRAQGSEWPGVVVLASSSYGPILSRNLLYTAITRARKAVVIVGDEAAVIGAVGRTRDQERVTGLPVLLRAGATASASGIDAPLSAPEQVQERASPPRPPSARPAPRPPLRGTTIGSADNPSGLPRARRGVSGAAGAGPPMDPPTEPPDDPYAGRYAPVFGDDAPYEPMPDDWPDD
ncbi:MAG: AAA family ATPase [Chloroflexi bacterium]|nr:AAA family ATPase [Chloroflexota bacterium]